MMPNGPYRVRLSGVPTSDPAPVGLWTLDESTGSPAADTSGNLNNGTPVNGPTSVPGKTGNALLFNGVDQEVVVADADVLSPHAGVSGEMSISVWVRLTARPSSGARATILSKGDDGDWEYGLFVYWNGALSFALVQPDGTMYAEPASGPFTVGVWHHVTGTMKKGVSAKIWMDGIPLLNQLEFAGDTFNQTSSLRIGRCEPKSLPDGELERGDRRRPRLCLRVDGRPGPESGDARRRRAGRVRSRDRRRLQRHLPVGQRLPGSEFRAISPSAAAPLKVTAMDPAPGVTRAPPPRTSL